MVSDETTVTGEEPAELPVHNETSFKIEHRTDPFIPGDKAALIDPGAIWRRGVGVGRDG